MIEITLDEVYDVFMRMDMYDVFMQNNMYDNFGTYCDFLKQFGFVIV